MVRSGSGGSGAFVGGDGLIREWVIKDACTLSLLTERRESAPYGLQGGGGGSPGRNRLFRVGQWQALPVKGTVQLRAGDRVRIETPGGGGVGLPEHGSDD